MNKWKGAGPIKTLGVLGGLGPAASCRFYEMLIRLWPARRDQDHPDVILYSKASIPDRTAHLLRESGESPLPALIEGIHTLERAGARVIAVPCVTAHHFYPEMRAAATVPVLDMLALTARALRAQGVSRAALLATRGSYRSGSFCAALEAEGVTALVPPEPQARALMEMIYAIKSGELPGKEALEAFALPLLERGARRVILGCTELSLFEELDGEIYMDPMRVLAEELLCV
ncbi:MAG: amino acid racemase [Oscillospiraceae bacterium]|nr:amino acid racemase [Oscillospiraceae bacterium]